MTFDTPRPLELTETERRVFGAFAAIGAVVAAVGLLVHGVSALSRPASCRRSPLARPSDSSSGMRFGSVGSPVEGKGTSGRRSRALRDVTE